MNFRRFSYVLGMIFLFVQGFASNTTFEGKQQDSEMDALRQWLREKRMITIKEIGGDLALSGEVRTEVQVTGEKKNGIKQRGQGGATSKPAGAWDIEVNLMLDYHSERTWSNIKLEFDNDMGLFSGTLNKIRLERAYFGGRVISSDAFVFDIELGRRTLDNVFDSKIEFSSLYDGVLFKFNKATEEIGDFYCNLGVDLINDRKDHYAQVGEVGFLRIMNTGFYTKYSFINWKKDYVNYLKDLRFNFRISQAIIGYQGPHLLWDRFTKFYAAFLYNHCAHKVDITGFRREPFGWYVGFDVGQLKARGDWAISVNYQWVESQAIPDFDSNGIKRGNAAEVGTYTMKLDGGGGPTTQKTTVGSCNFRGFQVECLYRITNNLTMLQNFAFSQNAKKSIGPSMYYRQYEVEFIYAF